jgi:uncharacterized membrane protein YccC
MPLRRGVTYAGSSTLLVACALALPDQRFFWSAIAALWTCLADIDDTARRRARSMAIVGLLGPLACMLGAWLGGLALPLLLVAALGWGIGTALCEPFGAAIAFPSRLLFVVLLVSATYPQHGFTIATFGLFFLCGGISAIALNLLALRSRAADVPRAALRAAFDALHALGVAVARARAPDDAGPSSGGPHGPEDAHDAAHGYADVDAARRRQVHAGLKTRVRKAIEDARRATYRERALHTGDRLLAFAYLVEAADAMFNLLIIAGECVREDVPEPLPAAVRRRLFRLLDNVRDALQAALAEPTPGIARCAERLGELCDRLEKIAVLPTPLLAATAQARELTDTAGWRARFDWRQLRERTEPDRTMPRWLARLPAPLRHELTRDSAAMRHGVRLGCAGVATLLAARLLHLDHGYWVSITVVMVLSPELSKTRDMIVKRCAGTLAGVAVASLLALASPPEPVSAALVAGLLTAAYTARVSGRMALFVACFTAAVVEMLLLGQPGTNGLHYAQLRGVDTLVGCALALAMYWLFSQAREDRKIMRLTAHALEVHGAFLEAAARGYVAGRAGAGDGDAAQAEHLRASAGLASIAAEDALTVSLRQRRAPSMAGVLTTVLHAARRLAGVATLLKTATPLVALAPADASVLAAAAREAAAALRAAAQWLRGVRQPLPVLPPFAAQPDDPAAAIAAGQLAAATGEARRVLRLLGAPGYKNVTAQGLGALNTES